MGPNTFTESHPCEGMSEPVIHKTAETELMKTEASTQGQRIGDRNTRWQLGIAEGLALSRASPCHFN